MVPHFITNRKVLLILGWTLSSSTICSYAEQNQASNANGNNKHYDAPNHIDRNKLHIKAIHNLRRQEKRIKTENVSSGHILNKQERTVSTSDEAIIKDRKSNSGSDPPEPMTRYIVKYKNELGRQSAINVAIKVYHNFDHDGYVVIEVDADGLARIQTDSNIESVEEDSVWFEDGILEEMFTIDDIEEKLYDVIPDHVRRHLSNDEQTPYGITMVQADQVQYGTNKVTVCIVDTGVRAEHPDFNPLLLSGGDRISTVDGTLMKWNNDTRGHGTHITGTINAIPNNNFGVRGMGAIPVYMTRGLNDQGRAYESDIREAMEQCEASNAQVVSLSLSGSSMSTSMKSIIDRMHTKNMLIIAASGNGGGRNQNFPASYYKVISVGAVEQDETLWKGSNYGPWIELTAPGASIVSTGFTWQGEYTLSVYSGTSMATPHVAGAAALLWSNYPDCTAIQIRYALAYTAKDKNTTGCDDYFGYGIIQVKSAYDFLSSYPCNDATWGQDIGTGTCSIVDKEPPIFIEKSLNRLKRRRRHNWIFKTLRGWFRN